MSHKKADRRRGGKTGAGYEDINEFTSEYEPVAVVKRTRKLSGNKGKAVAGVLLCIILVIVLIGIVRSPGKQKCDMIIEQFQAACNNMDLTGMVGCMKPSLVKTVATVGSLAGNAVFSSENVTEFVNGFVGGNVSQVSSESGMQADELFKNIKLEPKRYGFPARPRRVRCKASFGAISTYIDFYVTIVYGDPYIEKIRFGM